MVLRQFLYLDSQLVSQFLAQIEGGVYASQSERLVERRGKELGGEAGFSGLGAQARAKAGKATGSEEEVARDVQLTPEAEFARLYDLLSSADAVQWLGGFDEGIWNDLRRGELVEVEASVAVSTLAKYSDFAAQVGPLFDLMQAVGETVEDETKAAMQGLSMLGDVFGSSVPVVAEAIGAEDYRFAASLVPAEIRGGIDQLDGEATILGKVQRKLGPNETYTVFDLMAGIRSIPRAQRRQMEKDLANSPELPDMVISGPLAVVSPVAIYR